MSIRGLFLNRFYRLKDLWRMRPFVRAFLLRVFKPRVFWNLLLYRCSLMLRREKVRHKPFYAMLEPSSRCNLQCRMCWRTLYSFNREQCDMPLEKFKGIVDQLKQELVFIALWNYGEPLLNADIGEMVKCCTKEGVLTVLSTNGQLLDEVMGLKLIKAGLTYLIVAVDGMTPDVYEAYRRGGDFLKLETQITSLSRLKKETHSDFPVIELQFIVMRGNEHQVDLFVERARAWGADRVTLKKFNTLYHSRVGQDMAPRQDQYMAEGFHPKGRGRRQFCPAPWQGLVINADGGVVPCCEDYFSRQPLGCVSGKNLDALWNGEAYAGLRKAMRQDGSGLNMCQDCPRASGRSLFVRQ